MRTMRELQGREGRSSKGCRSGYNKVLEFNQLGMTLGMLVVHGC